MASILTTLTDEKIAAQHRTMSRESLTWLMKRIQGLRNPYGMVRPLTKETHRYVRASDRQKFLMGGLYYFYYDPKTKADLPYYDRFPLVLVLDIQKDGFMGLNLHYLPIRQRIALLDKLMDFAVTDKNNDIQRMHLSYEDRKSTRLNSSHRT